jgi:prepilin-type N-terminal cleavage/methylation domain-containing protein
MISLKSKEKGFTIVELLIVIVVIGILVALVITTFSGIQRRARDTERQTDIKAMHGQVEAYYAQNGNYPTLANLNDDDWVGTNLAGLDLGALQDPNGSGNDLQSSAAANIYAYAATPSGCDNGTGGDCTGYTLTATLEGGGTYAKTSLN